MDANLKADLDAAADEAMREYHQHTPQSLESATHNRAVLTDGICRITSVADRLHPPCVGEIFTDLGERFPVFDVFTREQAKTLTGKRVKLNLQMSARGTRYVIGMMAMPVDASTELWVCARCGAMAKARFTPADRPGCWVCKHYACTVCAYQMEVGV